MSDLPQVTGSHDLLRTLQVISGGHEEVPEGWRTSAGWSEVFGLSVPRTQTLLRNGVKAGVMERRSFRIESGARIAQVPHYREVR